MDAFLGSEPMGMVTECRLIDSFQNHPDNFLHQLVVRGHDAQRPEFSILLGNVLPLCRLRFIRFVPEALDNAVDPRDAHVVQRFPVNPCRHASLRLCQVCVGDHIEIGVIEVTVQSFVFVVSYSCLFFKAFQNINRISHGVSHTVLSELKMIYCPPSPCEWLSHPLTTTGTLLP